MLKILYPKRSALMWFISLIVRDVIPFMFCETSGHLSTRVREHLHTDKTPTSLNILGVLINVGNLTVTIVSRL